MWFLSDLGEHTKFYICLEESSLRRALVKKVPVKAGNFLTSRVTNSFVRTLPHRVNQLVIPHAPQNKDHCATSYHFFVSSETVQAVG